MTTKSFIRPLTDKQQQLKALQYTIYHLVHENNEVAGLLIQDSQLKSITLLIQNEEQLPLYAFELASLLEAFSYIFQSHESNLHQYINLHIYSNSVYNVNIIKEWFEKWKDNTFDKRPNQDLLKRYEQYQTSSKYIKAKYINSSYNLFTEELFQTLQPRS